MHSVSPSAPSSRSPELQRRNNVTLALLVAVVLGGFAVSYLTRDVYVGMIYKPVVLGGH